MNSYFFVSEEEVESRYKLTVIAKHLFFAGYNVLILFSVILVFSKTVLRMPAAVILAFLMSFDIGLIYIYKAPMNYSVAASVFETNAAEASSILSRVLFVWLPSFVLFCFLSIKSSGEIRKKLKHSILVPLLSVIVVIAGVFVIPFFATLNADEKKDATFIAENIRSSSVIAYYTDKIPLKYPFVTGDIFLTAAYIEELSRIGALKEQPKTLPQGIIYAPLPDNASKIILVIGESALREHHQLYGYPAATTPFMDSLLTVGEKRLFRYENAISPACYTRESIRLTLTFAVPSDIEPFLKNKSIIDMAKDAGYRTCWISNQDETGSIESIMRTLASSSDSCIFMKRCAKCVLDDLVLIPYIRSELKTNKKQFLTVHLEGSHDEYRQRYDATDAKALDFQGETVDYDRTIHHTDRVLREIYRIARSFNENVLIFYYSDHGELIGKDLDGHTGHGVNYKYKMQYHIPLVIMQNRPFINADSIVYKYYDGQTGQLNALSNIFVLSEFMGYRVADSLIEKSRIDGRYVRQGDGKHILYENIKD
jgi:glucan phosphoethanolaminetransferase (alkaline phosphatase superfamily)